MGCFMCERRRMSVSRDLSLSYIPRCASRGRIQWAPISVSNHPEWFRSGADGEREDGCEGQPYSLWSTDRTHDSARIYLARSDRLCGPEISHRCCSGACPIAVPTSGHLVRVPPEAVQSG